MISGSEKILWAVDSKVRDPVAKLLLMLLSNDSGCDCIVDPDPSKYAATMGVTEDSVDYHLRGLVEDHHLIWVVNSDNGSSYMLGLVDQ